MISPWEGLRRYPATVTVSAVTVGVGAMQLFTPVVELFERDPQRMAAGQWWRAVTSMFVQGDGWGQFAFNVAGLVIVGSAVEAGLGARRFLVLYFGGGVAAGVAMSVWFPHQLDSGSSAGIASMIGALTLAGFLTHSLTSWAAYLYGSFFSIYLAGLALGGPLVASIAGSLTIALAVPLRHRARNRTVLALNLAALAASAMALVAVRDVHGVGLTLGALLFLCMFPRVRASTNSSRTAS